MGTSCLVRSLGPLKGAVLWDWARPLWDLMLSPGRQSQNQTVDTRTVWRPAWCGEVPAHLVSRSVRTEVFCEREGDKTQTPGGKGWAVSLTRTQACSHTLSCRHTMCAQHTHTPVQRPSMVFFQVQLALTSCFSFKRDFAYKADIVCTLSPFPSDDHPAAAAVLADTHPGIGTRAPPSS